MKNKWQDYWLEDIRFFFRVRTDNGVFVEFEAYDVYPHDDGDGKPLKFMYFDDKGVQHWTNDVTKAESEPYVKGFIKWDGCSEVDFARNIHSCEGRADLVRIGTLFDKIFDCAKGMMTDTAGDYL